MEIANSQKEYYQLYLDKEQFTKVDPYEKFFHDENILFPHTGQKFVSRWINPSNSHSRLLVKHMMGMGKTIAAINTAINFIEEYRYQYMRDPDFNASVHIISFNPNIFKNELVRRPEFGYITEKELAEYNSLRREKHKGEYQAKLFTNFKTRIRKRLTNPKYGGFFRFYGYRQFFNSVFLFKKTAIRDILKSEDSKFIKRKALSEEQIIKGIRMGVIKINIDFVRSLSGSLVICDEIQNVYNSEELNNSGIAIKFALNAYDGFPIKDFVPENTVRALFLTGTAITNNPQEIVDLCNILVSTNEIKERINKYQVDRKDIFKSDREFTTNGEKIIETLLKDKVSFLSSYDETDTPSREIIGEVVQIPRFLLSNRVQGYNSEYLPFLKFIRCNMSREHLRIHDTLEAIPTDGYMINDIVLPGGIFNTVRISEYQLQTKNDLQKQGIVNVEDGYIAGPFLEKSRLKTWSTKYTKMLDYIEESIKAKRGKILINHQYVKGSGVQLIDEILRWNGMTHIDTGVQNTSRCMICYNEKQNHKNSKHRFIPIRYCTITGSMANEKINNILETYNSSANIRGEEILICVGSKKINEGYDFKEVRSLYVMHCPVNISTLRQIFGRAVRRRSHSRLPPEERNVFIYIFVSSTGRKDSISLEEKRYFTNLMDYIFIQKIDQIMNRNAIDAQLNRNIIFQNPIPKVDMLSYDVPPLPQKSLKELNTDIFNNFYYNDEINDIFYIIKRLFVHYSQTWEETQLIDNIYNPPFSVQVNTKLFDPDILYMCLWLMTWDIDTYYLPVNFAHNSLRNFINSNDSGIYYRGIASKIIKINKYYILVPFSENRILLDNDIWNRITHRDTNKRVDITNNLKNIKINYSAKKWNFYNTYRNKRIYEIPTSLDTYDIHFHFFFIENCIKYVFNILTNPHMKMSEYHNFYFKMLYFYNMLNLILYAENIPQLYEKYITEKSQYNNFLMSSISKSSVPEVDLERINKLIGTKKKKVSKELDLSSDLNIPISKKIIKVPANILPVGHFLSKDHLISIIPRIYIDNKWEQNNTFVKSYSTIYPENDKLIGYYEKQENDLEMKFKIRNPIQDIDIYTDQRKIKKGSACNTFKKGELLKILKDLGINVRDKKIKTICESIKMFLLKNEIKELNKPENKRVKWFYFHFEKQPKI